MAKVKISDSPVDIENTTSELLEKLREKRKKSEDRDRGIYEAEDDGSTSELKDKLESIRSSVEETDAGIYESDWRENKNGEALRDQLNSAKEKNKESDKEYESDGTELQKTSKLRYSLGTRVNPKAKEEEDNGYGKKLREKLDSNKKADAGESERWATNGGLLGDGYGRKLKDKIESKRTDTEKTDTGLYENEDEGYGKTMRTTIEERKKGGKNASSIIDTIRKRKLKEVTPQDLDKIGDKWAGLFDPNYQTPQSTKALRNTIKSGLSFKGTNYGKPLGYISKTIVELERPEIFTSPINKAWRAVLAIRKVGGNLKFPAKTTGQDRYNNRADSQNKHKVGKNGKATQSAAQKSNNWIKLYDKKVAAMAAGADLIPRPLPVALQNNGQNVINNRVYIVNYNTDPVTSLELQHRPPEVEVKPTSNWVSVRSMGRNNPFYMYTSGDDSITFEIVWFMDSGENREDVITKCRLLESWSKANGYSAAPPTLSIVWGDSELFANDSFILESAPYTLKNFQNGRRPTPSYKSLSDALGSEDHIVNINDTEAAPNIYRDKNFNDALYDKDATEYKNYGLLPGYAIQQLTFKRVTANNRTYPEIVSPEAVKKALENSNEPTTYNHLNKFYKNNGNSKNDYLVM